MADAPPESRERRGPPDTKNTVSVKVDNIPFDTRPEDLRDVFGKYGEIRDIYLPRDRASGRPRGFAFVRYGEQSEADAAVAAEQGSIILGRPVTLEIAKYGKDDRPPPSAGGPPPYRGGGGGGGYDAPRYPEPSRGGYAEPPRGGYDRGGYGAPPPAYGGGGYDRYGPPPPAYGGYDGRYAPPPPHAGYGDRYGAPPPGAPPPGYGGGYDRYGPPPHAGGAPPPRGGGGYDRPRSRSRERGSGGGEYRRRDDAERGPPA